MVAGLLGLLLLAGGVWYLALLALDPSRSAVTQVDVLGTLDYADRDSLRERVAPHLVDGFYRLDIDAIRQNVMGMSWINDAQVRRIWPAGLSITVQEQKPTARWNDDALLAADLTPFRPPQLQRDDARHAEWRAHLADLPRLEGSYGRHAELLGSFREYARKIAALGLTLRYLREDDRLSQTLELTNGTTIRLGYEQREQRLARFIEVYPRVMRQLARNAEPPEGNGEDIGSDSQGHLARGSNGSPGGRDRIVRFDMRYSNGFALSGTAPSLDS